MSVDYCSTVSSSLSDRYLLLCELHLKLVVSKRFYVDCFASEPGLRRVVFSYSLYHLGP